MKQLSVIVPIYNVETYLVQCIESLFEQGLDEDAFEVILINDGSTDQSGQLISELMCRHTNMIRIDQQNQGLSAARNVGVKQACGEYVFFLDSDDFVYPDSLKILLCKAKENDLDILRFDYWNVDEAGGKTSVSVYRDQRIRFENQIGDGMFLLENIYHAEFFAWLSLIKRDFLFQSHVAFEEGVYFEDIKYTITLSLSASRTMYVSQPAYAYRHRKTSIVNTFNRKKVEDLISISADLLDCLHRNAFGTKLEKVLKESINKQMVLAFIRMADPDLYGYRKSFFLKIKQARLFHL